MSSIDNRIVRMEFDNDKFEAGIKESRKSIAALKESLNFEGSVKGLDSINKAAKAVDLSGIQNAVDRIADQFSMTRVVANQMFRNLANDAYRYGQKIVSFLAFDPIKDGFKEYETQMGAIQTILANTESKGTTLEDVNAALDELNEYADLTIYNFTEMTKNIGTFTAAGLGLEDSVAGIKGVANLAAISGANSTKASMAMYQLSQALASGTVRLQDWMSIEHADMGGQVFQEALKETARVHKINIDKMIKQEGSFRLTLSKNWLTTEIMMETLDKFAGNLSREQWLARGYTEAQVDSIMKLGKTATDAATKVKTFTQLIDTTKEALGSGWTQTWEIVFGTFDESKEMFTKVSDYFNDLINKSAEARNSVLEDWKVLGGRDDLIHSFWNLVEAVESTITPIKEAFDEIIFNIRDFKEEVQKETADFFGLGGAPTEAVKLYQTSERKLEAAMNSRTPYGMSGAPQEAMRMYEAQNDTVANLIRKISRMVREFTKALVPSEETVGKLRRIFKGVAAAGAILYKVMRSFVVGIFPSLGADLKETGGSLLDILAIIGDVIVAWNEWLTDSGMFNKLENGFRGLYQTIKTLVAPIIGIFKELGDEVWNIVAGFFGWDDGLSNTWYQDAEVIKGAFDKINDVLLQAKANFLAFVEDVKAILGRVGNRLAPHVETLTAVIARFLGLDDLDFSNAVTPLQKVMVVVTRIGDNLLDMYERFRPYLSAAARTIGGAILTMLGVNLTDFQNAKTAVDKADVIMDGLGRTFNKIKNFVVNVKNTLAPMMPYILTAFQMIGKGILFVINDVFQPYLEYLSENRAKNGGSWLWTTIEFIGSVFYDTARQIGEAVGYIVSKFEEVFGKGTAARWAADLVFSAKIIEDVFEIIKLIANMNPITAFSHIAEGFGSFLNSMGKAFKRAAFFTGISSVLTSLALVIASISYLAYTAEKNATGFSLAIAALKDIGTFVGGLVLVSALLSELGSTRRVAAKGLYLAGLGGVITSIGILMVAVAGAMRIIGNMNLDVAQVSVIGSMMVKILGVIFAGLVLLQATMQQYSIFTKGTGGVSLNLMARSGISQFIGVALLLYSAIGAIKILSTFSYKELDRGMRAMWNVISMMGVVLLALNGMPNSPGNTRGVFSTVLMVLALAGTIKMLGAMDPNNLLQATWAVAAIMGSVAAVFGVASLIKDEGKALNSASKGVLAITLFVGAIVGISYAFSRLDDKQFVKAKTMIITISSCLAGIMAVIGASIFAVTKVADSVGTSGFDVISNSLVKMLLSIAGLMLAVGGAVAIASLGGNPWSVASNMIVMFGGIIFVLKELSTLFYQIDKDAFGLNGGGGEAMITTIFMQLSVILGAMSVFMLSIGGAMALSSLSGDPWAPVVQTIAMFGGLIVVLEIIKSLITSLSKGAWVFDNGQMQTVIGGVIGILLALSGAMLAIGGSIALSRGASATDYISMISAMVLTMGAVTLAVIGLNKYVLSYYAGSNDEKTMGTFFSGIASIVFSLGLAILAIGGATRMIRGASFGEIAAPIASMVIMLIGISASLGYLSKVATENNAGYYQAAMSIVGTILALGIGALAMAKTTQMYSGVDWATFGKSIGMMLAMMFSVTMGIRTVLGATKGMDWQELAVSIGGMALVMLALGVVTRNLVEAKAGSGAIASALMMYAVVAAVGQVIQAAGRIQNGSDVVKLIATTGLIAVLMYGLSDVMKSMVEMNGVNLGSVGKTALTVLTIVAAMAALTRIGKGANSKIILSMSAAMLAFAISMKSFSGILQEMSGVDDDMMGKFVKLVATISIAMGGLTAVLALIDQFTGGKAFAMLMALSAAFLSVGGSIALAGAGFKMLAESINMFAATSGENLQQVVNNLQLLLSLLAKAAPGMAKSVGAILGTLVVSGLLITLEMIKTAVPMIVEEVVDTVIAIVDAISEQAPKIAKAAGDFIYSIAIGFAMMVPAVIQSIYESFSLIASAIVYSVDGILDNASAYLSEGIAGVLNYTGLGNYDISAIEELNAENQAEIRRALVSEAMETADVLRVSQDELDAAMAEYGISTTPVIGDWFEGGAQGMPQAIQQMQGISQGGNTMLDTLKAVGSEVLGGDFSKVGDVLGDTFGLDGFDFDSVSSGLSSLTGGLGDLSDITSTMDLSGMDTSALTNLEDGTYNPTITPVIDDTNVKEFDRSMANKQTSFAIHAQTNRDQIASIDMIDRDIQNRANTGTINNYTFNQTNNSPKPLSRLELYRYGKSGFGQLGRLGV